MSRRDAVAEWAGPVLDLATQAGPLPLAGDPQWCELPPTDARKFAAVIRAALCWLDDDALERDLREGLEVADLLARHAVAGASRDVAAGFAELRPDATRYVSFAELQRRRTDLLEVA